MAWFNWFGKTTTPKTTDNVDRLAAAVAEAKRNLTMKANIVTLPNGKTALQNLHGDTIATYSRARDAFRGADRRGLTVIN